MTIRKVPVMRPIIWLGSSKWNLLTFPVPVRKIFGDELQLIQFGGMPRDAKPFRGFGSGVIELATGFDKEAYRCVIAIQLSNSIYTLHAFHKKSKKGVATPITDVALIKQRYQQAKLLEEANRNGKKH